MYPARRPGPPFPMPINMWNMRALWAAILVVLVAIPGTLAQGSSSLTSALDTLPNCALECLMASIGNSTCSATNQTCICSNEALQADMTTCVSESCTVKESLTTKNGTVTLCGIPARRRSTSYAVVTTVLSIISGLFIIQRFAIKFHTQLILGPDDWFTLICGIVAIPITVISIYGLAPNGIGHDIWTLEFDQITNFGKYFLINEVVYFAEISLLKLALLFFYLRIFPSTLVRRALWITVIFNSIFGIVFIFLAAFQCKPVDYSWNLWDGEHQGQCLNINAIAWSNAALSIALDIWMLAIPISQVHSLHLSWKRKIAVSAMFSVGTFVTVVSILRLHSLVAFGAQSKNPTWEYFDAALWSIIEIHVGIICICLPSFRQWIVRLFPALQSTREGYKTSHDQNSHTRAKNGSRQFASLGNSRNGGPFSRNDTPRANHDNSDLDHVEHDEIQLVRIRDPDSKSARSDPSFQSTL